MFEQSQVSIYSATFLGAKKFKGAIEGKEIDSCTVLVASPMPANGNTVGFTAAQMKFGTSENFERLKNLKYPCAVEVKVQMESTGNGLIPKLIDFQLKQPKQP